MITRRSILACLGLTPAVPVFAKPTISDQVLPVLGVFRSAMRGIVEARPDLSGCDLPAYLQKLVRYFNPNLGDMGRGHALPIKEILVIKDELKDYGFIPFRTPGKTGTDAQFIGLYRSSGLPTCGVWYGFVREHAGKHEAISFETTPEEVKNSGFQTLNEAINS